MTSKMRIRILRRHLAVADHIENLQPPVQVPPLQHVWIQGIYSKLPLLLFRPVTMHTGPLQHWCNFLAKGLQIRHRQLSCHKSERKPDQDRKGAKSASKACPPYLKLPTLGSLCCVHPQTRV